jgi:hypothetical protein
MGKNSPAGHRYRLIRKNILDFISKTRTISFCYGPAEFQSRPDDVHVPDEGRDGCAASAFRVTRRIRSNPMHPSRAGWVFIF